MNDYKNNDEYYASFNRMKRKRIDEIGSILKDWYGENIGKEELKAYFPKVVAVKDVLKKIVSNENYEEIELLVKLQKSWLDIVGSEVSANSKPLSLKDGVLTIQAKNSAWLSELKNFYSKTVETRLNGLLKKGKFKKVYYVSAGK
ncbi:MAG: DUF721 domain-containing protein [Lentisphaerota bacterium]